MLEAFAAGIPVLAPRAGGVVENIVDGWNGFLYTPQSVVEFADKLQQLVINSGLRQHMGEQAQSSLDQYSWDNTVYTLVSLWQELIRKRQPAPQVTLPLQPLVNSTADAQS